MELILTADELNQGRGLEQVRHSLRTCATHLVSVEAKSRRLLALAIVRTWDDGLRVCAVACGDKQRPSWYNNTFKECFGGGVDADSWQTVPTGWGPNGIGNGLLSYRNQWVANSEGYEQIPGPGDELAPLLPNIPPDLNAPLQFLLENNALENNAENEEEQAEPAPVAGAGFLLEYNGLDEEDQDEAPDDTEYDHLAYLVDGLPDDLPEGAWENAQAAPVPPAAPAALAPVPSYRSLSGSTRVATKSICAPTRPRPPEVIGRLHKWLCNHFLERKSKRSRTHA